MRAASSHEGLVQTPTLNEPAPLQLFKVASDELRSQHNRAHANVLERLVEAGEVRHGDDVDEEARADDNAHPKGEAQLKRGCGAGIFEVLTRADLCRWREGVGRGIGASRGQQQQARA